MLKRKTKKGPAAISAGPFLEQNTDQAESLAMTSSETSKFE